MDVFSLDKEQEWNPKKPVIEWNGKQWTGIDVPDYTPTTKPSDGVGPFIMLYLLCGSGLTILARPRGGRGTMSATCQQPPSDSKGRSRLRALEHVKEQPEGRGAGAPRRWAARRARNEEWPRAPPLPVMSCPGR